MKKTLLEILEEHEDFVSGELIAGELAMTRANVWKEIQKLKKQNIEIESVPNKGYRLVSYHDCYSKSLIGRECPWLDELFVYNTISSTNDEAKQLLSQGKQGFILVCSDQQTQGKGRKHRSFYSPAKGLYMSIAFRPRLSLEGVPYLTICSALAVCDVLKEHYNLDADIKWLNDIYCNGLKLCGILCEGEIEMESRSYQTMVVGIGLNLEVNQVPENLEPIMTAVNLQTDHHVDRNWVIIAILNRFYHYYQMLMNEDTSFMDQYRSLNFLIGRTVKLERGHDRIYTVIDINSQGHLCVQDDQGEVIELNSGEVSIYDWKN